MVENNSLWILPEELEDSEKEFRRKTQLTTSDKDNDFGSYRSLVLGEQDSGIHHHNILAPKSRRYADILRRKIEKHLGGRKVRLADVGCGAGFLTKEIARASGAFQVTGYDISRDAIGYARDHFPEAAFEVKTIDQHSTFDPLCNVIHAREFYPFTRTGDFDYQSAYVDIFLRNLQPGGLLIISMLDRTPSIFDNLERLERRLREKRAVRTLELNYVPLLALPGASCCTIFSHPVSRIYRRVMNKDCSRMLVLHKA